MSTSVKVILLVLVLAALGYFMFTKSDTEYVENTSKTPPVVVVSDIEGCYVQKLAKDVYTLNVQNENNGSVTGTLEFDNFEKDSSSGTFAGTYKDNILLGDYSFASEGTNSVMEVAFKKVGDNFIRGFGEVEMVEDRATFADINAITFDPKDTFVKSPCTAS